MFLAIILVLSVQIGRGDSDYTQGPNNTYWVTCEGSNVERRASGVVLTSSRGVSAFLRTIAKSENGSCVNQSELWIKRPKERSFTRVYSERGSEYELGIGMKLVDWSPSGRLLLIDRIRWQYASDAPPGRSVLLFDVSQHEMTELNTSHIFRKNEQDCLTEVRGLGFRTDSAVIVRVSSRPYFEVGEDSPLDASCKTYKRVWEVALPSFAAKRLSDKFQISMNARKERPVE